MIKKLVAGVLALSLAVGAQAADALMTKYNGIARYVAKDGDDTLYDGRSLTPTETPSGIMTGRKVGPFKTIQTAMGSSSAGDRVLVGPGEYTYEEAPDDTSSINNKAVVRVKKGVLLESSAGKDQTFIVGKWSTDAAANNGVGAGAVRCVYLTGAGACVKGFTLRNGATADPGQGNNLTCCGAGVVGAQLGSNDSTGKPNGTPTYAVDCIIENCRAGHGAAAGQGVMLINCLMRGNVGVGGNHWHCTYRVYNQYNCIFEGNGDYNGFCVGGGTLNHLSNCTFLFNKCDPIYGGAAAGERLHMYNCALIGNYNQQTTKYNNVLTNNVTSGTSGTVASDPTTKKGVPLVQQYSTVEGDYRLVSGSDLIDAGSDEGFAEMSTNWIPSDFADKDILGNPRKVGDHVDAGAVEAQGDEPALGYSQMVLMDGVRVQIGEKTYESTYGGQTLAFDEFPGQMRVTYTGAGDIFAYDFCGNTMKGWIGGTFAGLRYPDRADDQGVWVTPFQSTDEMLILSALTAAKTLWVDGAYAGGDSDGTEEKPYTTIQAAINSVTTSDRTIINVKKGTYTASGVAAVIQMTLTRTFSIRSVDGPEETIIKGGSGVNCVYIDNRGYNVGLSGFTFTGANYSGTGGALRLPANGYASANTGCSYDSANVQVLDSIISNNYAGCAGGMYGGWAQRCLFVNNSTSTTGDNGTRASAAKYAILSSCVFCDNAPGKIEEVSFSVAYNCSFHSKSSTGINMWGQPCTVYNCVEVEGNSASVDPNYVKCVGNVIAQVAAGGSGFGTKYTSWKDVIVNKDLNDLRFRSDSAALMDGSDEAVRLCYFAVGDYQGNALAFPNSEKPLAPIPGAFQQTVSVANATINDPTGATGFTESAQTFAVGEEVVISADKGGRPVKSVTVSVNGGAATPLDEGVHSYAWTPTSTTDTLAFTVEGDPNWYVDAENGDDAKDGFTPATAKKTLRGIMTVPGLRAGDTVHAAPGTYDQGVMTNDVNYVLSGSETPHPSRVVVPAGVALVADEGKEKTFILGEYHDGSTKWGANAVRGVYLYPGARVEGFTIKRASANAGAGGLHEYSSGGCVGAPPYNAANPAIIRNCTLTGGGGRNAGGVSGGLVDHCFISDCGVGSDGSCAINSRIENSVLFGGGQAAVESHYGICNSVIYSTGTGNDPDMNAAVNNAEVLNSVIFVGTAGTKSQTVIQNMRNCIFKADNGNATTRRAVVDDATCSNVITNNDITKVINTTTGALIPGSPAIDAGDNAFLDNLKGDKTLDLVGHPRVCNGTVDIGAREMMHWYVDATNGDDENNGFSPETAKKTLAAVMANVLSGETVHAAPGTYDEGEMTNTVKLINSEAAIGSRVVVPESVALIGAGIGQSIIKGRWKTGATPSTKVSDAVGDGALRGVYLYKGCVLEGFTITDAATRGGASQPREYCAGGCVVAPPASSPGNTALVRNCELARGGARNGAAAYGGILENCVIHDCSVASDGVFYNSLLRSCLVYGCSTSHLRSHYGVYSCSIYADGTGGDADFTTAVATAPIENSILYFGYCNTATTLKNARNCVINSLGNVTTDDATCSNLITNNNITAIVRSKTDLHLIKGSPAIDAGDNDLYYAQFGSEEPLLDLDGNPRFFNGTIDIGCYEYRRKPTVNVSQSGTGTTVPVNGTDVDIGDSIEVHPDTGRPVVSFSVTTNGVEVDLQGAMSYVWTPTAEMDTLLATVEYGSDWYVDATNGDDENNGFSPETAKKTLAAVMGNARIASGDTVWAAPGEYKEGVMTNTIDYIAANTRRFPSRVVVPAGVSLKSISGDPADTKIFGKWNGIDLTNRQGTNAVRAVYLYTSTLLEGFTITDGATDGGGGVNEYNCGGGVAAPVGNSANTAYIRNCHITRCGARNGGAGYGGVYENCKVDMCIESSDGLFYHEILKNCYIDASDASGNQSILRGNYYGLYNCTFYTTRLAGDAELFSDAAPIENCVFWYTGNVPGNPVIKNAKNCLIYPNSKLTVDDATCQNIITSSNASVVFDANRRPVAGSPLIDAGNSAIVAEEDEDVDGNPRIANGAVDIGAYEYDWKGDYAKYLKNGKVEVTEASPNVVLAGNTLTLNPATAFTLKILASSLTDYTVNFKVSDGTLTIDGHDFTTDGSYVIEKPQQDQTLTFSYSGTGTATIAPIASAGGLMLYIR